jgi:hypothetical protein
VYINVLLYLTFIETPACHGRRVEQCQMNQKRAQTPGSILKELILQYDAWSRAGGVRKSLFNEDSAEDDDRYIHLLAYSINLT